MSIDVDVKLLFKVSAFFKMLNLNTTRGKDIWSSN